MKPQNSGTDSLSDRSNSGLQAVPMMRIRGIVVQNQQQKHDGVSKEADMKSENVTINLNPRPVTLKIPDNYSEGKGKNCEADRDGELIEQTVAFIKERVASSVFLTAIEIGDYLLRNFFGDDIENATSKNPKKDISYRKLCAHPELPLQPSTLSEMVRIAAQERFFIEKGINLDGVHYTHRLHLIKLPNDNLKISIVQEIISKSLSSRKVKGIVTGKKRELNGLLPVNKPKSKKRVLKAPYHQIEDLNGLLKNINKVPFDAQKLQKLTKDKRNQVLETAMLTVEALNEIRSSYLGLISTIRQIEHKKEKSES